MSLKVILTAAICICLGVPALSHLVLQPRRMPKFGFPPGRIRLPGRSMKFPRFQPRMPYGPVSMSRPGRFLPRLVPKPFMFHKKGPIHQHMLHKMRKMAKFSKAQPLPILSRYGKSHRGSFQDRSTRRFDNSRVFIPRTLMLRRQHAFDKQPFGKPTMPQQPHGRSGAVSGTPISGGRNGGYGNRPVQTYGTRRPTPGHAIHSVNQVRGPLAGQRPTPPGHAFHSVNQVRGPLEGQRPVQNINVGFQGGNLRHHSRTFNDADMFDNMFDDRFDRGFETDDFRGNNVRDIDEDFRDSLEVPDIFGTHSGLNQNTNTGMMQDSKHPDEYYNRQSGQHTPTSVLGLDGDKLDDIHKHSVASTNAGPNPFNIPPGFLDRQTGVNSGGGIGVLQTLGGRRDDMFDDVGEGIQVPFDVNFNTMNPVENTLDSFSDTNSAFPTQQRPQDADDRHIEPNPIGFPGVIPHQSAHFETTLRSGDDIKDVDSGFLGQNMAHNSQINGLELLGNNHPNMMAGQQFWNTEREGDLHNVHPTNIQVLPFNPHSDENNGDAKDSPIEDLGDGTLEMLGIDPRTIDSSMLHGHFNMPSSITSGTSPVSSQFTMHQPAQLPASLNMNNPAPFTANSFNEPSNVPFAPASSHNPSESMFVPSIPTSPGQQFQVPQAGAIDSEVFPDIPMDTDVFYNIFNQPLPQGVDNAANGPIQQDMSKLQFAGTNDQMDDFSILSQIPSVDDLAFGSEKFNVPDQ